MIVFRGETGGDRPRPRRRFDTGSLAAVLAGAFAAGSLSGCHSAFVDATLINRTDKNLHLVEVDYPSASFGTQNLAPGTPFHYRFKIIGEGPVKLSWTDDAQKEHTAEGPALHEGQGGLLTITIAPGQTAWQTTLK